jgi:acetyl-CoA C-acetyltransferase
MSQTGIRPVVVGCGQINDRPEDWRDGLDSLGLMEAALRRAEAEAGGAWLADLDGLDVVEQISCPEIDDLPDRLARVVGADRAVATVTELPHGDSPVRLLNEAANRIAAGEARVIGIAGGEALRTAAARNKADGVRPGDLLRTNPRRRVAPYRQAFGITAPVDLYPFYENASRHGWGQTLKEGQAETGEIWSRMSRVAAAEPQAWLDRSYSADQIVTVSPDNRAIAHPYTKLMVANASVNQGAAFLVTSEDEALRRGVSRDRLVYVGHGAGAAELYEFLARDRYDRSAAMEVVLEETLARNAVQADTLDHVELYSCFPCVPKMARRTLGWPVDRPVTVFGGLTFGGAPVANYMSHAVACMAARLRGSQGMGLLYGNGGIVTTQHAIVLSGARPDRPFTPLTPDVQTLADQRMGASPDVIEDYTGPAEVETWTVRYDREGAASRAVIVARTATGARSLAEVPVREAPVIAMLTDGAICPIGMTGQIETAEGIRRFVFD